MSRLPGRRRAREYLSGLFLVPYVGACVVLSACAPQFDFGSARVLKSGVQRLTASANVGVALARPAPSADVPAPGLQVAVGYRRGLPLDSEAGLRLHGFKAAGAATYGAILDFKKQLLWPNQWGLDASLATGVMLGLSHVELSGSQANLASVTVPIVVTHHLKHLDLTWGPRFAYVAWFIPGEPASHLVFGGASFALSVPIDDRLTLSPEVTLMYSPQGFDVGDDRRGVWLLQFNLAGSFRF